MQKIIIKVAGLVLLPFLLVQPVFSQENYLPGYVLTPSSDTLKGFVDYRNWERNPRRVAFKPTLDGSPQHYTPAGIQEFGVQDEIYRSAIVNSATSSTVDEDHTLGLSSDTTFLQTIFAGKKYLYYLKNSFGVDNFYIRTGDSFELLEYRKYLKEEQGRSTIRENKKYLGQLTLYLNDCPSISTKLPSTEYTLKSLENIFEYYYKTTKGDNTFGKKEPKNVVEIGILGGVSLTSLKFKGDGDPDLSNTDFNKSLNFTTGVFFDVIFRRNQGKLSLNNEALITSYRVEGESDKYHGGTYYTETTTAIGYTHLKINTLLRFKYPMKKEFSYFFFNGGISNAFAILSTNQNTVESRFAGSVSTKQESAVEATHGYEQGFVLGTGIKNNKWSYELRYERGNGMSAVTGLNSGTNRLYFLVGLLLQRK